MEAHVRTTAREQRGARDDANGRAVARARRPIATTQFGCFADVCTTHSHSVNISFLFGSSADSIEFKPLYLEQDSTENNKIQQRRGTWPVDMR